MLRTWASWYHSFQDMRTPQLRHDGDVAWVAVIGEMKLGSWRANAFEGPMPYQRDGSALAVFVGVVMRRWMQSWVARLEVICGTVALDAIAAFVKDCFRSFPVWNGHIHIAETVSPPCSLLLSLRLCSAKI